MLIPESTIFYKLNSQVMIYWTPSSLWKVVVGSGSKRWAFSRGRPRLAPHSFLQLGYYGFFFFEPNPLRSSKIRFYLCSFGFCVKIEKIQCNSQNKNKQNFPPLKIIAGWNTHNGSYNKTMVLFTNFQFFASKPKIQYIGRKKVGFFHPCGRHPPLWVRAPPPLPKVKMQFIILC